MHTIDIPASTPYQVHIGTMLLEASGEIVRDACGGARAVIVTDSNVGPLYAPIVKQSLDRAGYEVSTFTFPAGERSKRASTLVEILEFMATRELGRDDVVVALGGGVVGDLAQIPTSLLAMVDSSVGGKTAIDLEAGKNLAGAFWQPRVVIADVGCLGTLEPEQLADGCGEVIKHGVIADAALFGQLEQTPLTTELLHANLGLVAAIIARNVEIKRDVVAADEREAHARKLLNFGHSAGHAIEALEEFRQGHGTCVAQGMVLIARAAVVRGTCAADVPARIEELARRHGLDTACRWDADAIFAEALHDKKRAGDAIDVVMPRAIGSCAIERMGLEDFPALVTLGVAESGEVSAS